MQRATRSIEQNLIDDNLPPIRMQFILETALSEDTIQEFLGPHARYPIKIGLSPAYAESGMLAALAMAIDTRSLVVQFHGKQKAERESVKKARALLQSSILCHDDCILYAFDLGPLATALFYDHGLHMLRGIDVQSACSDSDGPGGKSPLATIEFALGDKKRAIKSNVRQAFADSSWDAARTAPLVLRAWIASYLPTISDMEEKFNAVKPVNTKDMEDEYLSLIAQITCGDRMLASKKPTEVGNEFNRPRINHSSARMDSERFQTRFVRKSAVTFTVHDDSGAIFQVHGRAVDVQGRSAKIRAEMTLEGKTIISAVSADDQRVTIAERQKAITILLALQGHIDLFENPFLKCIFVPQDKFIWPEEFISSDTIPDVQSDRLNPSQLQAVERMLSTSNSDRIVIIQGPPGTGKTTVIAAFVCSAVAAGMGGIWLVAQTNVAVKNIAEKLAAVNFTDWRLLVSTDFEFGWHEHLYRDLNRNIIRSHQFKNGPRLLQGASVVLCTLSMLSNPHIKDLSHVVPLTTLVVDEASQIAVQNYIPPLAAFSSFRKMCFIGDDRQLPPYGQDEIEHLRSIFELPHLRNQALMLDTQYRMPPHIGEFISDAVYDGQLASNPDHPVKESLSYFVHVEGSREQKSESGSYSNKAECEAVAKIAAVLQENEKNYKIITPYDAQRNQLQEELKNQGLIWENKCFNVDSFQGNEEDYIIISLVRSKQRLGFLEDLRRTNVMLTRCKRGMYIVSSWEFIWGTAQCSNCLVGRLAANWGKEAWKGENDLEEGNF